ncbi:MAG TPA: ABC transporter permease subunit [Candidatus Limiplasma sp.]|nr:ABC transporter permease subunit [Candidatus Limiplasma sp.]
MNIYRREMKTGFRPLFWWCLGLIVFIAASASKFAAMGGDVLGMTVLMAQLPAGLKSMLGVGALDFTTALGFYGMMIPYLVLLAAVHAVMLGAVSVSREERDHVTEFLYAKPASRTRVLTAKLLAAFTQVALLNVVNTVSALVMLRAFGESATGTVLTLALGMLLVQLVFLALGAAAAGSIASPKVAAGVAAGGMLATYLVSVAVDINGHIGWLKAFSPFAYFDARAIVGNGQGLSAPYALLSVALIAAFTALAYLRFTRRDLKV